MSKKAFTLSEVLIALVVIGVVAAITIPTFMTYVEKEKTVTQLKKVYSSLANAYNLSVLYNGPVQEWEFGKNTYDWNLSRAFLNKYFVPYIYTSKDFNYKVGAAAPDQYVLLAGAVIDADVRTNNADIMIDLNGAKKPNRLGRDIFVVRINAGENYKDFGFAGAIYNRDGMRFHNHGCSHKAAGNRYTYCGALIQADNWQIKSDYPW